MIIWGAQLLCEARLTSALELYRSESIFCFTWHVIGSVGTPRTQHTSSIPSRIKHVNKSPVLVVVSQLVKLESKVAIPNPRSRSHDCGANAIYARRVRDRPGGDPSLSLSAGGKRVEIYFGGVSLYVFLSFLL